MAESLEINSIASGRLSVELLKAFADAGGRSLTVETASDDRSTMIRVGNAGVAHALPPLIASCAAVPPPIRNTARNEAARALGRLFIRDSRGSPACSAGR